MMTRASTPTWVYRLLVYIVALQTASLLWMMPSSQAATCQKLTIPAYFYPGPLWDQAIGGASVVGIIMIMNPASGPGLAPDANYAATVKRAQQAGITVLGYVHTSYGAQDRAVVESEIDRYKAWYQVDGIFLDEVSSAAGSLPYYQTLAGLIRATPGSFVMLNPGTFPDPGYMDVGDVVVVFEGDQAMYLNSYAPPGWVSDYSSGKFCHLIYGVPDATAMTQVIDLAQARDAGYVFVTDDILPNPWDTLPAYWSDELHNLVNDCLSLGSQQ